MDKIGSVLIFFSFFVMLFEWHLKNPFLYSIFILTGVYVIFSALFSMPKNILAFMNEERLIDSVVKKAVLKFQVVALSIAVFIYFVLRYLDSDLFEFLWWIIFILILTSGVTIVALRFFRK
ncbi:MAG: hypothetical protein ACK4FF_10370 [Limnobacter sp.]|uniref:hypothetical protein n=1 Tax=Limnobacter sp. TaxID=2003368 RepID=UPI003918EF29